MAGSAFASSLTTNLFDNFCFTINFNKVCLMIKLSRNNNKSITLSVELHRSDYLEHYDNTVQMVSACLHLVKLTVKSSSNLKTCNSLASQFTASLDFATLRIAEQTAESLSYVCNIPCKWHLNFGCITKHVI